MISRKQAFKYSYEAIGLKGLVFRESIRWLHIIIFFPAQLIKFMFWLVWKTGEFAEVAFDWIDGLFFDFWGNPKAIIFPRKIEQLNEKILAHKQMKYKEFNSKLEEYEA